LVSFLGDEPALLKELACLVAYSPLSTSLG